MPRLPKQIQISIASTIDLGLNLDVLTEADLQVKIDFKFSYDYQQSKWVDTNQQDFNQKKICKNLQAFIQKLSEYAQLNGANSNSVKQHRYHIAGTTQFHDGFGNGIAFNLQALPVLKKKLGELARNYSCKV